jgi:hypothetical protein
MRDISLYLQDIIGAMLSIEQFVIYFDLNDSICVNPVSIYYRRNSCPEGNMPFFSLPPTKSEK